MTPESGHVDFDVAPDRRWTIPIAQIGGLPIAVIDRADSAQLMIDAAFSRRDTGLPPLVFTSANGQVLSLCARDPHIRDLFLASRPHSGRRHAAGVGFPPVP